MQNSFFETGKGDIGYVLANGFGVAMALDKGMYSKHGAAEEEPRKISFQINLTGDLPRQGSA